MAKEIRSAVLCTVSGLCFAFLAEWAVQSFSPIPPQSEAAWMLFALGGCAFLMGHYAARGLLDMAVSPATRKTNSQSDAEH